jgi:hypothetical protein
MDNLVYKIGPPPSMVLPNCRLKNGDNTSVWVAKWLVYVITL